MTLADVKKGEKVRIIKFTNGEIMYKFDRLGVKKGDTVTVPNIAPIGSPIEIKAANFRCAVALSVADKVVVEYV